MKITEIIDLSQKNDLEGLKRNLKPYLPFLEKTILVNDVLEACIIRNDKYIDRVDIMKKNLVVDIYILRDYFSAEFDPKKIVEEYDQLKEAGAIDFVKDNMNPAELDFILNSIEESIEQEIKISNSIEGIIATGLDTVINKIPKQPTLTRWVNKLADGMKNFNTKDYNKLMDVLNSPELKPTGTKTTKK